MWVAWRVSEDDPCGNDSQCRHDQHGQTIMLPDPQLISQISLFLQRQFQHFGKKPEVDIRIDKSDDKQHLDWRKTQLPLATDIVSDEITRALQELPNRHRHRSRAQSPDVHHTNADTAPRYAPKLRLLGTAWTIITAIAVPATLAAMLLFAHMTERGRSPNPALKALKIPFQ